MSADGSRHRVGLVAESSYGTTPSSPTFATFRHTGSSLKTAKDSFVSEELRADRQIADFRHGVKRVEGGIDFEFLYDSVFHDVLEAVLGGTWTEAGASGTAGDTLKAGVNRNSFTIVREFTDVDDAGADVYATHTGCELDQLSLTLNPNGIVTGSVTVLGQDTTTATTNPGSFSAASTAKPFDSFSGSISEGGSPIAIVTGLELQIANGLAARYVVGTDTTIRPSIGKINVTGTLTAFFESKALVDKFLNETESSVEFSLTDGTNTYTFELPRIKYSDADYPTNGDGPITLSLPFQALYNSADSSNIIITR